MTHKRLNFPQLMAFFAFALWLLSSWGGAQTHLCLDGQEPPLSTHLELMGEHPEHIAEQAHADTDLEMAQPLLAKLVKIDLGAALIALVLLALFRHCRYQLPHYSSPYHPQNSRFKQPPLRAPPLTA